MRRRTRGGLGRTGTLGVVIAGIMLAGALLAPWLTPYPGDGRGEPHLRDKLQPPSAQHWFGTDEMGRDVLARILFGARTSLALAAAVVLISLAAGVAIGLVAGYAGGWYESIAMRLTDVCLAFPPLLLAALLAASLGGGWGSLVLALALAWWPVYAVLVRGEVLRARGRPHVEAARATGAPALRIMLVHVLPEAMRPVAAQATLDAGAVILVAAGLSFVGLGAQPPTADWGNMINSGRVFALSGKWWVAGFPGLAIMVTTLGCVLIGDSLQRTKD